MALTVSVAQVGDSVTVSVSVSDTHAVTGWLSDATCPLTSGTGDWATGTADSHTTQSKLALHCHYWLALVAV